MIPVVLFYYNYKKNRDTANINLGDYVQTLAVESFCDRFFPDAERILLDRDELAFYKGKPALVIMQGWFSFPGNLDFLPSPDLIPVFVGTHFTMDIRDDLVSPSGDFFRRFRDQEIGCRDRSTMHFLRAAGWNAYFSRCLTLTFPRRTDRPGKQNKIFWVDVPESFQGMLPPAFRRNVEIVHQRKGQYQPGKESFFRRQAADLLGKYRDEAACVVTTAIHCAMPCAAMGIPVLFLKKNLESTVFERWSALYGIIPVYTESELKNGRIPDRIPDPPEFEELKENILKNTYFSCLKAMGKDVDAAEAAAARKYIAEFNRTDAVPYDSLRTKDAAETLRDLRRLEETLYEIKRSCSYRTGLFITWVPRKIAGLFRCMKENGWNYTVGRVKQKLFRRCR